MTSKLVILLACFVVAVFGESEYPEYGSVGKVPDDILDDPARNLDYERLIQRLKEKKSILIDVRDPEETNATGTIPTSVLIPLPQLENALGPMSPAEFKKKYKADKPAKNANIIFSCHSGTRSRKALAIGYSLGYTNSVHYKGGWTDWVQHNKRN